MGIQGVSNLFNSGGFRVFSGAFKIVSGKKAYRNVS